MFTITYQFGILARFYKIISDPMNTPIDLRIKEKMDISQEEAYSTIEPFLRENENVEGVLRIQLEEALNYFIENESNEQAKEEYD